MDDFITKVLFSWLDFKEGEKGGERGTGGKKTSDARMSWMSLFANLTFQQKNGGKSGWRELERATERERERERERDLE